MASQLSHRLGNLLHTLPVHILTGSSECLVSCVVADSRQVIPGSLFVAVRGLNRDGHQFLQEVLDQGAVALVVETVTPELIARAHREGQTVVQVPQSRQALALIAAAFYGNPSQHMRVVGITGTNGKTTTTYVVESILQAAGASVGVCGTVDYRFPGHREPASQTTPDALQLQTLLGRMQQHGVDHVVMEVSSHALDQDRVTGCAFDTCVFTNLSQDHYDYHGSEAAYFEAKARLFTDADLTAPWHVLNLDDPYGERLLQLSQARVLTYGLEREATLMPQAVAHGLEGIHFTLPTTKGTLTIRSALIGRHNVYNILAGIATALSLDVEAEAIVQGIAQLTQVPGRLERIDQGQAFHVFVDYAHTPDALNQVLQLVRAETSGRFISVFGCGGDRDTGKRPLMGRVATSVCDYTVITSDNPRTEDPQRIIEAIEAGVDPSSAYITITDRQEAISHAISIAEPNDTIVIAGKGHEDYQIIGHTRRHFDDGEVARAAIDNRR